MNAVALKEIPDVFDNVIDSGLFHSSLTATVRNMLPAWRPS